MATARAKRLTEAQDVAACWTCGHAYHNTRGRLSIGRHECGQTIKPMSLSEWCEQARTADLRLTPAGRLALQEAGHE